jgi:hypothetical protein
MAAPSFTATLAQITSARQRAPRPAKSEEKKKADKVQKLNFYGNKSAKELQAINSRDVNATKAYLSLLVKIKKAEAKTVRAGHVAAVRVTLSNGESRDITRQMLETEYKQALIGAIKEEGKYMTYAKKRTRVEKIDPLTGQVIKPKSSFGPVWVGTADDWKVIGKDTNPLLDYFAAEAKGTPILERAMELAKPLFNLGLAHRAMLNTMFRLGVYAKNLSSPDNGSLYTITAAMEQTLGTLPALFYKVRTGVGKNVDFNKNNLSSFQILLEDAKVPRAAAADKKASAHPPFDGRFLPLQAVTQIVSLNSFPNKPITLPSNKNVKIPSLQAKIEEAAAQENGKDPKVKEEEIRAIAENVNIKINELSAQVKAAYEQSEQYKARKAKAKAKK